MRVLAVLLLLATLLGVGLVWVLSAEPQAPGPQPLPAHSPPSVATAEGGEKAGVAPPVAKTPPDRSTLAPGAGGRLGTWLERPFTGRVIDLRGEPIVDATVYTASTDRASGLPLERLDPEQLAWARRSEATTDAAGRFEIAPAAAGTLRLAVRARGFAPGERTVSTDDPIRELGDLALEESVVLEGRVLDAARRPVGGAAIRCLPADARPAVILGSSAGDVAATTGADGVFRVDELASGPWLLLVKAEAYPDKLERGAASKPGEVVTGLEIVLEESAEISGRVLQASPAASSGLWVHGVPVNGGAGSQSYVPEDVDADRFLILPRSARCAADGTFRLRGLSRGVTYRLAARASEHDMFAPALSNALDVSSGATDVALVYKPRPALVFQVVDAVSAQPVNELEVRLGVHFMQPLTGAGDSVVRDFPDGRVRFEHGFERAEEALTLEIEARGYQLLRVENVPAARGGEVDLGILRLARSPTVSVRVVADATERAVEGADVALVEAGADLAEQGARGDALHRARTDAEGAARLNSRPGRRAQLRVLHPDFAPFQSEPELLSSTDHTLAVRLRTGGTVVVEVRDVLGAVVPDASIRRAALDSGAADLEAPGAQAKTDAHGRVQFDHLPAGMHAFEVEPQQPWPSVTSASSVLLRAEARVSDGSETTLTLTVPARGRLSGRITEAGQPLSGATLLLAPELAARTNGQGDYSLANIELGTYQASVVHPTRALPFECQVEIREVRSTFSLDLPLAVIEGRLFDEDQRPLAGMRVRVRRIDTPSDFESTAGEARVTSAADGTYVLRGVPSNIELIVQARGADYALAQSQPVSVAAGAVRTGVDLQLAVGAALEVHAAYADGRSASGLQVRAYVDDPNSARTPLVATTDPTGSTRWRGLTPGKWRVELTPKETPFDSAPPLAQTLDVQRGQANVVTFELR
jgi:protocatechuate 3,4-dioxygenase beta subunit